MLSVADLRSAVNDLKSIKTTTKDGTNILMPLLDVFDSFLNGFEQCLADQKSEFQEVIKAKDCKIEELNLIASEQKEHINRLTDEIDSQNQYTRRETLILSGDSIPTVKKDESCIVEVCKLVANNLGEDLNVTPETISIAHRLGNKPSAHLPDRRSIIVRFCRRKIKYDILNAAKSKKPANLFVNESLTPTRQKITRALRRVKALHPNTLAGYQTSDGSITALVKPPSPDGRLSRVNMDTMSKLEKFCQDKFHLPVAHFLQPRQARHTGTSEIH